MKEDPTSLMNYFGPFNPTQEDACYAGWANGVRVARQRNPRSPAQNLVVVFVLEKATSSLANLLGLTEVADWVKVMQVANYQLPHWTGVCSGERLGIAVAFALLGNKNY